MSEQVYIYTLKDPRTGEVRYVGCTNNVMRRLYQHRSQSSKVSKRLSAWKGELKSVGELPEMAVVEECPKSEGKKKEREWIGHFIMEGHRLLNYHGVLVGKREFPLTLEMIQHLGVEIRPVN